MTEEERMKPSIGRIVHYRLSANDVEASTRRRVQPQAPHKPEWPKGAQAHVGNPHGVGQIVPLLVVVVWPNEHGPDFDGVNGQAFLDGNDVLWICSAKEGTEPGNWQWPKRD